MFHTYVDHSRTCGYLAVCPFRTDDDTHDFTTSSRVAVVNMFFFPFCNHCVFHASSCVAEFAGQNSEILAGGIFDVACRVWSFASFVFWGTQVLRWRALLFELRSAMSAGKEPAGFGFVS